MTHRIYSATAELQVAPEDGADATVYWLVPSDTQVKRKADGACIPKVVTCKAYSKTGEGEAVALTGVIKFALLYKTGGTSGEFAYASNIIITADMAGISFRLYIGGKQLDQQTVTVVDDGPTGDAGPMGKRGVLPYPQGEWDAKTVYTATENVAPYVWYEPGKQYYVLNKVGSVSGTPPPDDYISAKNWVPFDYLKAVYAELFMARFGKLGSAVFWGDYMFSQWGKNAQGQHSEQYDLFDPDNIGNSYAPFTPNILIDFLKGKVHGLDMDIKGGTIGGFRITDSAIEAENSDGLLLTPGGLSFNKSYKSASIGDTLPESTGFSRMIAAIFQTKLDAFDRQDDTIATLAAITSGGDKGTAIFAKTPDRGLDTALSFIGGINTNGVARKGGDYGNYGLTTIEVFSQVWSSAGYKKTSFHYVDGILVRIIYNTPY